MFHGKLRLDQKGLKISVLFERQKKPIPNVQSILWVENEFYELYK